MPKLISFASAAAFISFLVFFNPSRAYYVDVKSLTHESS